MTDQPFTNREIREFVSDIKGDIQEIKEQTQRTNGRVSALEQWRWFILGGLTIISMLIVPILLRIATQGI